MSIGSAHGIEHLCQVLRGYLLNMLRVHFAATLYDREHCFFVGEWAKQILSALSRFNSVCLMSAAASTDIRLIRFDDTIHRLWQFTCKRVTNSMGHEPRGLVLSDVEVPHKLMRAHAFLTRREQVNRQQPFVQRYVRILKDCADCDRELLFASATLPDASWSLTNPLTFADHLDHFLFRLFAAIETVRFANDATASAYGAIRPAEFFEIFSSRVFVYELRF